MLKSLRNPTLFRSVVAMACVLVVASCGDGPRVTSASGDDPDTTDAFLNRGETRGTTIQEAFARNRSAEQIVLVNRYLWRASLEVLDFLPVQEVDPFTGVIITGFGTPPGSGNAYRATILIQDPALDARSLNLSLQTRRGPASAATVRAVEDAILTRARQLRSDDGRL